MNTSYIQNQIKLISFMKCETNVSPLLIECWSLLLFIYAFLDTTMNYNKIGLNKNVRALWSLYLLIYNSEQLLSRWLFWAAIQLLFYHFSSSLSLSPISHKHSPLQDFPELWSFQLSHSTICEFFKSSQLSYFLFLSTSLCFTVSSSLMIFFAAQKIKV